MADVDIQALLRRMGFEGSDVGRARAVLEDERLTRPGKVRIAKDKEPRIAEVLRSRFITCCFSPDCVRDAEALAAAGDPRAVVRVGKEHCMICGGSDNSRAVQRMAAAMRESGRTRLLVVGGTPNMQRELASLLAAPCEVRFVLVDDHRNSKVAAQESAWADLVVIWASTPIPHKVTMLYQPFKPITVARRGLAALADGVVEALARSSARAQAR